MSIFTMKMARSSVQRRRPPPPPHTHTQTNAHNGTVPWLPSPAPPAAAADTGAFVSVRASLRTKSLCGSLGVCVRVCACEVRACVCARACVCVCVCVCARAPLDRASDTGRGRGPILSQGSPLRLPAAADRAGLHEGGRAGRLGGGQSGCAYFSQPLALEKAPGLSGA